MGNGPRARRVAATFTHLARQEISRSIRSRDDPASDKAADRARQRARAVRQTLEELGPFYTKVGQILSTRPDLVPPSMIVELQKLHDQVSESPFTDFEPVLAAELGPNWTSSFRHIDTEAPLGTASLAQVYQAILPDGTSAAVKIQRPGIRQVVEADMALLRRAARFAGRRAPRFNAVLDIDAMLGVVFDAMRPELDFVLEARNMKAAGKAAAGFKHVAVPTVLSATPRVLIQSLAPGCSVREADPEDFTAQERLDIGRDLLAYMYRGYFLHRSFHADPHPGNVFVHPGSPAHLIDWGMVGRIDRPLSQNLLRILLCLAQNDSAGVARAWIEMGHATPWAQIPGFSSDMDALVPQVVTASLEELNFGVTLTAILKHATRRGIKTHPMISVLGKSFANLEGSIRHLCPELTPMDVVQEELRTIIFGITSEFLSETQAARTLLEAMAGSSQAIQQMRGIVRDLADHELSVNVKQVTPNLALRTAPAPASTGRSALLAAGAFLLWRQFRKR